MGAAAYGSEGIFVAHANGLRLTTEDGSEYLDACSGTFNVGLGYGNKHVINAITSTMQSGLLHGSSLLQTRTISRAEEMLVAIAPKGLDRAHLKGCTGGSTAVEQAIRHVWAFNGRRRIVGFQGGHHGQTIASSIVSGMPFRKLRLHHISVPTESVPPPDCYRCPFRKRPETCKLECADAVLNAVDGKDNDLAAAFLAEPIMGAGGGIVPSRYFWLKVSEGLHKRGVPLILDEVQTFGRVGGYLAADYFGVKPTMVVLAKSISGVGLPGAGALLLPSRYCLLEQGERSLTWGGANIVSAAICATLEIMGHPGFFEHTRKTAALLNDGLERIASQNDRVGCVRGVGLMTGIEIVKSKKSREPEPKFASALVNACKLHRLIVRQSEYGRGSFVKIRPALTISCDEVVEICTKLEAALRTCERP
jgi:4-aminobutyrate aminotransferase